MVQLSLDEMPEEQFIIDQATRKIEAHRGRRIQLAYKEGIRAELNASTTPKAQFVPGQAVWVRCSDPKNLSVDMVSNGDRTKPGQRRWAQAVVRESLAPVGRFPSITNTYPVECLGERQRSRRRFVIATTDQLKKRVEFPSSLLATVTRSESGREERQRIQAS